MNLQINHTTCPIVLLFILVVFQGEITSKQIGPKMKNVLDGEYKHVLDLLQVISFPEILLISFLNSFQIYFAYFSTLTWPCSSSVAQMKLVGVIWNQD